MIKLEIYQKYHQIPVLASRQQYFIALTFQQNFQIIRKIQKKNISKYKIREKGYISPGAHPFKHTICVLPSPSPAHCRPPPPHTNELCMIGWRAALWLEESEYFFVAVAMVCTYTRKGEPHPNTRCACCGNIFQPIELFISAAPISHTTIHETFCKNMQAWKWYMRLSHKCI